MGLIIFFCFRRNKIMMHKIKDKGYDQQLHEHIMWERTLDFYLQQNAFLKIKLSQALDSMNGQHFLVEAEHFQNIFIQNDDHIKELQIDIDHLQRSLNDGTADEMKLKNKQSKLNSEINNFEKNFAILKISFFNYMESIKRS